MTVYLPTCCTQWRDRLADPQSDCYTLIVIRAIYFDYHGVLDRRTLSGFLATLTTAIGHDDPSLQAHLEQLANAYATGAITPLDFWDTINAEYGPATVEAGKKYVLHVDPNREAWEILNRLHETYSLGLFTDCPADKKEVIVHAYNLPDFFDQLIFSCDARQSKIDPNFFRRMLRDGLYQPAECLLIDDSHQAIGQAKSLGFMTHQYIDLSTLQKYLVNNGIL